MPIPESREELLDAMEANFAHLAKELGTVPAQETNQATLEGHAKGTEMSVHNLVSHLLDWNDLVLNWIERDAQGGRIDFPERGFKRNQLGAPAQKLYADFDAVPFDQLLRDLGIAERKNVDLISDRTDEEQNGVPRYGKSSMGRMIQFNTSSPYASARGRGNGSGRTTSRDGGLRKRALPRSYRRMPPVGCIQLSVVAAYSGDVLRSLTIRHYVASAANPI